MANKNNLVRQVGGKKTLSYPILSDGTYDIYQGDMVYFDTSAKVVKPVASNANAQYLAGVAAQPSFVNVYGTKKYVAGLQVLVGNIHSMGTVAGQTYAHGDALYYSTDAQTVTPTDPGSGNIVGHVWLKDGQAAVAGASGTEVECLMIAQYPFKFA